MMTRPILAFLLLLPTTASLYVACSDDPPAGPTSGTDAATADSGSGTDAPTADSPSPGTISCAQYCDQVTANCAGDLLDAAPGTSGMRYVTKQGCLNACAKTPTGNLNDVSGDTVGCRQYHSGVASGNPTLHCPHAGLSGVDICSTSLDAGEIPGACQSLCDRTMALCSSLATKPFATLGECHQACRNFALGTGKLAASGDTFGCREYHLALAYDGNGTADASATAESHCPHIAADSGPCR